MMGMSIQNMKYGLHIYCQCNNLFETYTERAMLHNNLKIRDSGFDLVVPESISIFPGDIGVKIDHQIQCLMEVIDNNDNIIQDQCGFYLYARSSTGSKTPLRLSNSVGIIDPGYRGNIIALFDNNGISVHVVDKDTRVAQICAPNITYDMDVFVHLGDIETDTLRGTNGFGSSGC